MKTMLYKYPGPHRIDRDNYSYLVVDSADVDTFLDDGWFRTPAEAKAGEISLTDETPTRGELEIKANELGIKYDGRTGNKALLDRIEDALGDKDELV